MTRAKQHLLQQLERPHRYSMLYLIAANSWLAQRRGHSHDTAGGQSSILTGR
jgi:hypothetical protein